MAFLATLLAASLAGECPNMEGVWAQGSGERILVMEQDGCRLKASVAEPENQVLHVRGFWTGSGWTMAATRLGRCSTTAWGTIRAGEEGSMLINVRGSDGLCGPGGAAGTGPVTFNATITYRRVIPNP